MYVQLRPSVREETLPGRLLQTSDESSATGMQDMQDKLDRAMQAANSKLEFQIRPLQASNDPTLRHAPPLPTTTAQHKPTTRACLQHDSHAQRTDTPAGRPVANLTD